MATSVKSMVIAVAVLAAGVLCYRYTQNQLVQDTGDQSIEKFYTATGFSARMFDQNGTKVRELFADAAAYGDKSRVATFEKPVIRTFRVNKKGQTEVWNLSGDTGEARSGDFADLHRNVELHPEFQGSALKNATTDNLHYDFHDNTVSSPDKTAINGHGWTNSGTDFKIDLNTDLMTYKGNVNATYFPSKSADAH